MPIAPQYFDTAFKKLGVSFTTSKQCSWENYSQYNSLLSEIQVRLSNRLDGDVSLLDAHSFAWMLASKIEDTEVELELQKYDHLPLKEREAIVKARIGQGRFRQQLLEYWETCAVTGCEEISLLVASHIKPWSECDVREAVDPYNGLLLSPNLDAAFDNGYVSFTDTGEMLISQALRVESHNIVNTKVS
jgi:predicted restriction endonuclease